MSDRKGDPRKMSRGQENKTVRVLYSFPHKFGPIGRINSTAWQQVNGLLAGGANVTAFPGVLSGPIVEGLKAFPTLAWGGARIPYKVVGTARALALHDYIVSRRLRRLSGQVDIVHAWPSGALRTLRVATEMGIPTVLERPSAHTRFVYEAIRKEYARLGIPLSNREEYRPREDVLKLEEEEFRLADYLLCPSDFVVRTFREAGFPSGKLIRHQYGFDDGVFYPETILPRTNRNFTMLFVGFSALIKGLQYALEAWLQSPAHRTGTFLIAGTFTQDYARKISSLISHPSVSMLGRRDDVPELMRRSDLLVLPSLAEGSALVTSEARASGCVPLVSDNAGAYCEHMKNGLVHQVGDVKALAEHITMLHNDRSLLARLRASSLNTVHEITWAAAGAKLLQVYRDVLSATRHARLAG